MPRGHTSGAGPLNHLSRDTSCQGGTILISKNTHASVKRHIIRVLMAELFASHTTGKQQITSRLETSRVLLNIEQAIPCGLILNELVTNALKHAYPDGNGGEVVVHLEEESTSGQIFLSVSDDGIGLSEGFDWKSSRSMGPPIVEILTRQIGGELQVQRQKKTVFTVSFPGGNEGFGCKSGGRIHLMRFRRLAAALQIRRALKRPSARVRCPMMEMRGADCTQHLRVIR